MTLRRKDRKHNEKRIRDMENKKERILELRHLRYFITLAEELHFARAAERLQMEQSPLSRAIREMERLLGVRLFERSTRSTRITRAGTVLLDYARRAIALMEQGKTSARSAALGQSDQLRIAVSDCAAYCRMTEILARYRAINPSVAISLLEVPLHQQISGIRDGLIDASISLDGSYRDGIQAQAVAHDRICAAVPVAHPLAHAQAVLPTDLARYPLIMFSAESDLGSGIQVDHFVDTFTLPYIAFRANSLGTMLTLVALGHGIGLVGSAQAASTARRDVVIRPFNAAVPLTTYVLHSNGGVSEPLGSFIEFAREQFSICDSTDVLS
jgi:DNA-binding transcriptional LysR family regulator